MTSLANPTSTFPVQYISDTEPENGNLGDWWWRTTVDPSTEAIALYISDGAGNWVHSGALNLGTLAAPP